MNSSIETMMAAGVVVVVVLAAIIYIVSRRRSSARLKSSFGAEYERALDDAGSRRKAELELRDRQKRVSHFDIRTLTSDERDDFARRWRDIQAEFVDQPKTALNDADALLTDVMRLRGYPMGEFEQRSADLSVDHPEVVQNYRAGHEIANQHKRGLAGTEELRQAMIHYRSLFEELVEGRAEQARRMA
jgi:hypothetical protein